MDEWKIITEYPDYAVSNAGRIRLIVNRHKSKVGFEPKPSLSKKGYLRVALYMTRFPDRGRILTWQRSP